MRPKSRSGGPAGTELLGHLPVYGVFRTLPAYCSNPRTAGLVQWLPDPRRRVRGEPHRTVTPAV
ncbi:hypothetical protein [Actinoplanes sp. NPDC049265]|uniref:hypothetical protein n=1 Tax=Actinoplanes sp. NPDC049265 TaxID=3363902 RepID=UPI003712B880